MRVTLKNAGSARDAYVDSNISGLAFKELAAKETSVPLERMKVMIKGKLLKDDALLSAYNIQEGQIITVIGTAAPLNAPIQVTKFLEDLAEGELAGEAREPVGLVNLGQTCYLNSSLQVLRAIPDVAANLQAAHISRTSGQARLANAIKTLFASLDASSVPLPPYQVLNDLRSIAPQFAEQDRTGGFAQQDADEAWTQIISALRTGLMGPDQYDAVERMMSLELLTTRRCSDAPDEVETHSTDKVLKLECNITISTNFLLSGILDSLDQQVEKMSPSLGRSALYDSKARLARIPQYLTIHMVRFYWRRDIQKKAKIMRKVKYPLQFDVTDLLTDNARAATQPVNSAVKQILKDRDARATRLKRDKDRTGDAVKQEEAKRGEERTQIAQMIASREELKHNGCPSAIYELCALVTHKGASADSGHYIGWRRDEQATYTPSGEETWSKFDDDKVSTVSADKILAMDGGGEDSVAYILLYRSIVL